MTLTIPGPYSFVILSLGPPTSIGLCSIQRNEESLHEKEMGACETI